MKRILFVCTGNTCRSPMAQALFLKMLQDNTENPDIIQEFNIGSAGLYTTNGLPASDEAVETMQREGLDIANHRSRVLDIALMSEADLVLTMGTSHRDAIRRRYPEMKDLVYTLGEYAGYEGLEIHDPLGAGVEAYARCASQLKEILPRVWYNIKQEQSTRR